MSLNASYNNTRTSQDRAFQPRGFSSIGEASVRCKHCSKVIPVDSVEEHETFFCPLKPVRCQHFKNNGEMCGFLCSGADALRDHYKVCRDHPRKRRSVSMREGGSPRGAADRAVELCEDCQQVFPDRASVMEHQRVCPVKSVPCPLHCGVWMPRSEVPDHILYTAARHKPLRRPSVVDYGGDNIHMVVAVLMEALQRAKKAPHPVAVYEETMSNIEPSMSFAHPFAQHSAVSVGEEEEGEGEKATATAAVASPESLHSASLPVAGSTSSSDQPADLAVSVAFSGAASFDWNEGQAEKAEAAEERADPLEVAPSPRIEEADQDVAPPMNAAKGTKAAEKPAARAQRRKTTAGGKSRRSSTATTSLAAAPSSSLRSSFRASPSQVRYEDFVLKAPTTAVHVSSPPRSVRLRQALSRGSVSPRAQLLAAEAGQSPRLRSAASPTAAVSPRKNGRSTTA